MKKIFASFVVAMLPAHAFALFGYEGTLYDSNGTPIEEDGVVLEVSIFDEAACTLWRSEYTVSTKNSKGHFAVVVKDAVSGANAYNDGGTNTLEKVLESAVAGGSLNCAEGGNDGHGGTPEHRQIQLTIASINGADIADVALPKQKLDLSPLARYAVSAKTLASNTVLPEANLTNGQFSIDSAGAAFQVWTSDGDGRGKWAAAGSGDMVAANNLNDLANTTTALSNLGGQPADADLTDLADGSLTGSKVGTGINGSNVTAGTVAAARVENGTYFINSAGTNGQVWTSDGTGAGQWAAAAGQAADADLDDLADGSLTGSKVGTGINGSNITTGTVAAARVENGTYFINSAGTGGQVWTSDGSGAGQWSAAGQPADADLTDLADGSLTGSKVGTGIAAGNITTGNLDRPIVQTGSSDAAVGQLTNNGGPAADNGDATINFANKNVVTTTFACTGSPTAITLQNLGDGGAYSLIMTGNHTGSCTFTLAGVTTRYPAAETSVDLSSETNGAVVTFLRAGSELFVSAVVF